MKGRVFNIKRFAVHDGPGIRVTVFLKGCPLRCWWCHNPEAVLSDGCEIKKIQKLNGNERTVFEPVDREMTVEEVMKVILKEQIFMDESGGGVTFSGGEPFIQTEFLMKLLEAAKLEGIHATIDTSGYVPKEKFIRSFPFTDLYLFDLKLINLDDHIKYTGRPNHLIISNIRVLSENKKNYRIRIPLVPGINTSETHISEFLQFIDSLTNPPVGIDLLPYHKIGSSKYERFGIENKMTNHRELEIGEIDRITELFSKSNLNISVGG
jgi:pyruvate formate lyase activating enzyme